MVYLINLLIIPIYYIIIHNLECKQKAHKHFAILVCIHATLFRALANPYNYVDTVNYAAAYESLSEMSWMEYLLYGKEWGVGYVFLNFILSHICSDPQFLFVTLSAITVIPIVWFYYKTSGNILLSMLIFLTYPMLYYMGFGVVRQHAAAAFVLLSLLYMNNFKIAFPLMLIASSLHTSAVLVLPYFLWRKINVQKMSNMRYILLLVVGVLLMGVLGPIVLEFMDTGRYDDALEAGENRNIVPVLLLGSLIYISILNRVKYKISSAIEIDVLSFVMYGLVIALFSMGVSTMGRATIYFIYALPSVITWQTKLNPKNRSVNNLYIVMVFILITYLLIHGYQPGVYDYSFFWEKQVAEF